MVILYKLFPFLIAFAANGEGSFINKLVCWGAGIGGAIVALFIIISLVKDGFEFAKGQGSSSVWKIVGKVLFLILIIGMIFLVVNYNSLGNTAKDVGTGIIDTVNEEVHNVLP